MNSNIRPAPPSGAPPAYTTLVSRVYPYALRGPLIGTSFLGAIYGLVGGVEFLQDLNDDGETGKMGTFDVVIAIFFLAFCGIELAIMLVGILNKVRLGRMLWFLVPAGAIAALGIVIVRIMAHFIAKTDIINQCVNSYTGATLSDGFSTVGNVTTSQAQDICNSDWNRGTWQDVIWIVITLLLGFLWISIALSYYRQLVDPSSIRTWNRQASQQPSQYANSYPLEQQASYPPYQPDYVPPYPGPARDATHAPTGEKEEFSYSAQEEAWRDAQRDGPTAHLTGQGAGAGGPSSAGGYAPPAGPPPGRHDGYDVPIHNEEEEEAWARARQEGVTAHLTGDRLGTRGGAAGGGGVV